MQAQKQKILVIEDEKIILKAFSEELRDQGFMVVTATNGQEGLVTALSEKPDLILLDILMPVMDGLQMMKKLRLDPWGRTVPIILLTNLGADEKILKSMIQDKPLYFLIKSDWNISDVADKIKAVFSELDRVGVTM